METRNQQIRKRAVEIGKIGKYEYWIVYNPHLKGYNGYVVFPKRPTIEEGYNGILIYVPVHGGITYASEDMIGMVYGFDVGHCDSENFPISDKEWTKNQCQIMIAGIMKGKEVEKKYLTAKSLKTKAKYVQMVWDTGDGKQSYNFGININLLAGSL